MSDSHGDCLLPGNGFRFAVNNNPAEVKPQHGLILALYYQGELPVEEHAHCITLARAPYALMATLNEYWTADTEAEYLDTIWALQPAVEALGQLHLTLIRDPTGEPLEEANLSYGQAHAAEVETFEPGGSTGVFQFIEKNLQEVAETCISPDTELDDDLATYLSRLYGLEDMSEVTQPPVIYHTIETLLFYQLQQRTSDLTAVDSVHAALTDITSDWRDRAANGVIPFETASTTFDYPSWFLGQWAHACVRVVQFVCDNWLNTNEKSASTRFLSSLPAIGYLLNPLLITHWKYPITAEQPNAVFPWAILSSDDGVLGLHKPPLQETQVTTTLARWVNSGCQLYQEDQLDTWLEADIHLRASPSDVETFARDILEQIVTYIQNLVTLYESHQLGTTSSCTHCEAIRSCLNLEARGDIETHLRPLLTQIDIDEISQVDIQSAAAKYSDWLRDTLETVYTRNDALDRTSYSFPDD